MNRSARWVRLLAHDWITPDATVPSRRQILWNTRAVGPRRHIDLYWSEITLGATPAVKAELTCYQVTRWIGTPYVLWRVEGSISLCLDGVPGYSFSWSLATLDPVKAREEFNRLRGFTRRQLLPSLVRRLP